MQSVRTVVRTLIAVFLATAAPVLAAPAVRAHAQEVQQQSFRTNSAGSGHLTISVDGVSPSYATPTATITVRGTVTNDTGSPVTGVQVQLLSSSVYFQTRSEMDSYAAGHDTLLYLAPEGTAVTLPGTLHSGKTARWSASFTAASVGYPQFGVYPLAAQAEDAVGTPLAIDRTLLPYWPGNGAATPLNVAWIWPLIDAPQQGMCGATLATNSLAGSLSAGGRLGTLLDVGQQWATQDDLTWAVDPALLSDVNVMTSKYAVGGSSTCSDRQFQQPSVAAAQWLSLLRASTATEPMLFTPYADADVAALTKAGLEQITRTAYHVGESVTSALLPRQASVSVAWPTDGAANASTLTSLAHDGGASAVVLNSGQLPSSDGPVRQRPQRDHRRGRHHDGGAARRLGDHRPARVGVGEFVSAGAIRRGAGLPRGHRDDPRRGAEPAAVPRDRPAAALGPVRGGGGGAAVDDLLRAVAAQDRPVQPRRGRRAPAR